MKVWTQFILLLTATIIVFSCNDECRNYVETPCQSSKTTGPRSYVGQVLEKLNDSTFVGISNCFVVDTGWTWNDTQCGSTQCPFFATTQTDGEGRFSFSERPTFVSDPLVIVRKEGYKEGKQVINSDSLRIVLEKE